VRRQIETAGLEVLVAENASLEALFADIGAVVLFLKVTRGKLRTSTAIATATRLRVFHHASLPKVDFAFIATVFHHRS